MREMQPRETLLNVEYTLSLCFVCQWMSRKVDCRCVTGLAWRHAFYLWVVGSIAADSLSIIPFCKPESNHCWRRNFHASIIPIDTAKLPPNDTVNWPLESNKWQKLFILQMKTADLPKHLYLAARLCDVTQKIVKLLLIVQW